MRVRDVNRTMGGAGATTQDGTPLLVRRRRDYPRVAVAMGNGSDPLLSTWVKSENNPVVWENPTMPCSFPGRVWQHTSADGKEQHWSMVRPSGFVHATRQRCWVCWVRVRVTSTLMCVCDIVIVLRAGRRDAYCEPTCGGERGRRGAGQKPQNAWLFFPLTRAFALHCVLQRERVKRVR